MNSILDNDSFFETNKEIILNNVSCFKSRFAELSSLLQLDSEQSIKNIFSKIPSSYKLLNTKNGTSYTLCVNNNFLHSKYDVFSEAERIQNTIPTTEKQQIFLGLGLGYHIELFSKQNPNISLTIIEPDIYVFFLFLASRNLKDFFAHKNLILLIGLTPNETIQFLASKKLLNFSPFFLRTCETTAKSWYEEFQTRKLRSQARLQVNANTAKKFTSLWVKNAIKNLYYNQNLASISSLNLLLSGLKVLIFAAGPTLEKDIYFFSKQDLSTIPIIAVDTACRSLIKNGIIPDFVVTGDPQYFNFKHLQHVDLKHSILVSEITIFHGILRLKAQKKFVFTQGLPIIDALFDEIKLEEKSFNLPLIVSGGSVATTAYSFAQFLGAKEIYFSGLDLSFVDKKTHFRGSTFEEKTHSISTKLAPSQSNLVSTLYDSKPFLANSTGGGEKKVLTEKRMQMYAWWFESAINSEIENIKVFTFSSEGLKIPNITLVKKEDILVKQNFNREMLKKTCQGSPTLNLDKKKLFKATKSLLEKLKVNKNYAQNILPVESNDFESIIHNLEGFFKKLQSK